MNFIRSIFAMLQFCTVLPLGKPSDYDLFAKRTYLLPIAGYVVGGIAALAVLYMPSVPVTAAVALFLVLILSGCNHFDGLLDLGDAMMAHGSREKRIVALTDRQTGAGAVAAGTLVLILSFSGLLSVASIPVAILVSEVLAKMAMSFIITIGRPFKEGMHAYVHGFVKPWFPAVSLLLCLPLFLLPVSPSAIAVAFIAALAMPLLMYVNAHRLFGGVNGDVVGATNEVTRAAVIIVLSFVL